LKEDTAQVSLYKEHSDQGSDIGRISSVSSIASAAGRRIQSVGKGGLNSYMNGSIGSDVSDSASFPRSASKHSANTIFGVPPALAKAKGYRRSVLNFNSVTDKTYPKSNIQRKNQRVSERSVSRASQLSPKNGPSPSSPQQSHRGKYEVRQSAPVMLMNRPPPLSKNRVVRNAAQSGPATPFGSVIHSLPPSLHAAKHPLQTRAGWLVLNSPPSSLRNTASAVRNSVPGPTTKLSPPTNTRGRPSQLHASNPSQLTLPMPPNLMQHRGKGQISSSALRPVKESKPKSPRGPRRSARQSLSPLTSIELTPHAPVSVDL